MISDSLRDLYQEVIIDHSKNPRNFKKMDHATFVGEGFNPLCGDKVNVYLQIKNNTVEDISFEGSGCAISTASASMMTEVLKGKTINEVEKLFEKFHHLVTHTEHTDTEDLGKLEIFQGVGEFPTRVKCATLAWHTVLSAIHGGEKVASTE